MSSLVLEARERCIKSFLDVIIASILSRKASWGYEIIAYIHERLHILLSPGAVYPILYGMERNGLIKGSGEQDISPEHRKKKLYVLTDIGVKWFDEMLNSTKCVPDIIKSFSATE